MLSFTLQVIDSFKSPARPGTVHNRKTRGTNGGRLSDFRELFFN